MRDDILNSTPEGGQVHCDEVEDRLPLFVGDDLDPSDQERVREHIARCPVCAARFERASEARTAFVAALDPRGVGAGESLWTGVRARLEAEGLLAGGVPVAAPLPGATAVDSEPAPALGAVRRPWQARLGWVAAAAAVLLVWLFGTLTTGSEPFEDGGAKLSEGLAEASPAPVPTLPVLNSSAPIAEGLHLPSLDIAKPQGDAIAHGLRRVSSGDERLLDHAELQRMRNRTRLAPSQVLEPGGVNEMAGYR